MFERFTDRARVAVTSAQEEARSLRHGYVGTEHLLLALSDGDGVGAKALARLGFDRARFTRALLDEVGRGHISPPGHIPFTPRVKQALEVGLRQSWSWGHTYIGTEHLLIGLLRDDSSLGTKLMAEQGISATKVEPVVLHMLAGLLASPGTASSDPVGSGEIDAEAELPASPFAMDLPSPAGPQCPACRQSLGDDLAADVVPSVGEVERMFTIAYCRACGHTLAVVPDD